MNYCKDCKYFSKLTHKKLTNLEEIRGLCHNEYFKYDEPDWGPKDSNINGAFYYWDSECCHADFEVTEQFGCIHFLEKD